LQKSWMAKLPAIGMSYYAAVSYCLWLWHKTPYRFRLPSEAEWNFAATGGARQRFSWGEGSDRPIGHFSESGLPEGPAAVDATPSVGPYGLVGLAGNIWEYCSTLWQPSNELGADLNIELPDLAFVLRLKSWWQEDRRVRFDSMRAVPGASADLWTEDVKI